MTPQMLTAEQLQQCLDCLPFPVNYKLRDHVKAQAARIAQLETELSGRTIAYRTRIHQLEIELAAERQRLAEAQADTRRLDYLISLPGDVMFWNKNGNYLCSLVPDDNDSDSIVEGKTLREAIDAVMQKQEGRAK